MKQKYIPPFRPFTIYCSFFYGFLNLLWYLPLAFTILPFLFFLDKRITLQELIFTLILLVAIPVMLEVIRFLRIITTYSSYPGWDKKLPFRLEGWDDLVQIIGFPSCQYWQLKVTVSIEFATFNDMSSQKLSGMLENFIKKTERAFYAPNEALNGFVNDPREQWKIDESFFNQKTSGAKNILIFEGSLNCRVAYHLYQLIKNDLTLFVSDKTKISKITITPSPKSYYIEPLRGQSEGTAS